MSESRQPDAAVGQDYAEWDSNLLPPRDRGRTVAALFVEKGGIYYGLDGVDPWDEERDARLYAGPHPVVAHPPCTRWSILGLCRGYGDGEDGGCFEAALSAVRTYGGVLEHPRYTLAWRRFGLPVPAQGGWSRLLTDPGWSAEVDQANYGHEGRKPTWLYYVGDDPPPLRWGPVDKSIPRLRDLPGRGNGFWRSRTPVAFRDELLAMARMSSQAVAA